mmetsp:Transcript_12248/g.18290  ORF Transcript_12248/g.18290 Transcript_12248/m.18290 type:complete len:1183 (-) Transcript_12248:54-3602(-)
MKWSKKTIAVIMLLWGIILMTQIITTKAQCTMEYPEICWENIDISAQVTKPSLIRHTMAWVNHVGLIIYGGLDPNTNNLNNNVYFIHLAPPLAAGGSFTVVGITTLCREDQNCLDQTTLKPRMDHSMVYKQNAQNQYTIVIYGGLSNVRMRDCWRYTLGSTPTAGSGPNVGTWTQQNDLSSAGVSAGYMYGHTATLVQHPTDLASQKAYGRIIIFGGTSQINAQRNDVFEFWSEATLATNLGTWTSVTPLVIPGTAPTPVSQHCAAAVHDFCLYVYGGLTQLSPLTSTHQLFELCRNDPANASYVNPRPLGWTSFTTTYTTSITPIGPLSRYSHQCTKAGNRLLAHGGRPNIPQPNYGNDMIDYDPILNIWGRVTRGVMYVNDPGTIAPARSEHASAFVTFYGEYYQFYHGGQSSSVNHNDLWVHNYRRPECDGGYYAEDGTLSCLPCPGGAISPNASYFCYNCTHGQYTEGPGQFQCHDCPLGTFLIGRSAANSSDCTPCPIGTYSDIPGRNYTCDDCPYGTYSGQTPGRPFCFNCSGGTYNNFTGSVNGTDCRNCSARYYAPPGSRNCTICAGGTYNPLPVQPACFICLAGTWSDEGEIECHDCPIGTSNEVNGSAGADSCVPCRAGTYAPAAATPQCILCLRGYYSPTIGATNINTCQSCPLGTYNPNPGAQALSNCSSCPQGTYQDTPAAFICKNCSQGKFNEQIGSVGESDCTECPAGTYGPNEGLATQADCVPCPPGHYQPLTGQTFCLKCPNGTYSNVSGTASRDTCLPCEPDTYSNEGQGLCTPCNVGSATNRSAFSFKGWENCQVCSESETSFGWMKNGHFGNNPIHKYWEVETETNCVNTISNGVLRMTSTSNNGVCRFRQVIPMYSNSTFPYHIFAEASGTFTGQGSGRYINAVWSMTLQNGTVYTHTLTWPPSSNFGTQSRSLDFTPVQVTSKDLLAHLHVITSVTVTLTMYRKRGTVTWDNIKFSPFSSQMCNCSKELREAEYYHIDLFNRKVCERCLIGKFCNGAGQFQCGEDTYSYGGFPFCRKCTKGLQCVNGIASTCELTQFKNETSNRCQDCPLDSGCRNTDRHICQPGTYGQGHRHCYNCPRGSYCNEVGCTSCTTCPDGQTSNYLRTECFGCPLGHYSTNGLPCQSCDWGTYSDTIGASVCKTCPGATNTTCIAAKSVDDCA